MEKYQIIQLGNPELRKVSEPIQDNEFGTDELKQLELTLFAVLKAEGGLGLAAPQIGIRKRAIVFGMHKHPRQQHLPPIPFTVLFNPSFGSVSDVCVEEYEGCMSVGKLRGKVARYKSIIYRGYDASGTMIEREATDLHARVLQHELDHLDGIIFLDRVTDQQSVGFQDELINSGALK